MKEKQLKTRLPAEKPEPVATKVDLCAGGVNPGWDECQKCGATPDESCGAEVVLEQSETLDGRVAQTVRVDGIEFVRAVDNDDDMFDGDDDPDEGCSHRGGHSWVIQDGDDIVGEGRSYCEHCLADGDA